MTKGLRKGLTQYGDEGFALFLRRAFIKAAGYSDDALDRPIVGIASASSDFNPCHSTSPRLVEAIKRGVELAGGLPLEFPTISLHESFAWPTSMLYRNLMSMDVEEMIRAQPMDAVVMVGGCDKTVPAQIMGAISANIPAQMVVVGPMLAGNYDGERLGACTDCRRLWSLHRAGEIDDAKLAGAHGQLMPTHGTCMVMGTASTMAVLAEALGFMLPGTATIPAVLSERLRAAEAAGARAVTMAKEGSPLPRDLVTEGAIRNAMTLIQALGGSTNAVIHLAAMIGRAGLALDLDEYDRIGRDTPVLLDLKPSGTGFMEDFHAAGGLLALMKILGDRLDTSVVTGDGRTLAEVLQTARDALPGGAIRGLDNPLKAQGAMAVLRGNLAPDGAILKISVASPHLFDHTGPALVFNSLADMAERIDDPDLDVTPDHVLILRNAGPVGAPGMPEAGGIPIPMKLARAGVKDMVRISDARMSGTAYGTIILHAAPEAAIGGPLAKVRDGDPVHLDVASRRIDVLVPEDELAARTADTRPHQPTRGYQRLYAERVLQADRGCDFDFLVDDPVT